jgi:hypothetical protein
MRDDEVTAARELLVTSEGLGAESVALLRGHRVQEILVHVDDAEIFHHSPMARSSRLPDTKSSIRLEKIDMSIRGAFLRLGVETFD